MIRELDLNGPAWAFALDFYGRPGVSAACLTLQDRARVDVVVLVMALFSWSTRSRSLSDAGIVAMRAALDDWRATTVLPLRQIRRSLKPARDDLPDATKEILRSAVKKAELLAEQIQIAMAWASLDRFATDPGARDLADVVLGVLGAPERRALTAEGIAAVARIVDTVVAMPGRPGR